ARQEDANEAPAEAEADAARQENMNEAPAEAEDTPAAPEELQQETAESLSAETIEEEPLPVIELPVIGVPIEEPFAGETERAGSFAGETERTEPPVGEPSVPEEPSEKAADGSVPDLSQIRVEELVFDPDSSAWEEPDDGLLRDDDPEKWMQEVDITANETKPPKEEREASERELTEAALAAMFREDDVAIERALYDLLKKD
ncbi:MAG: hypothetical protein Q4C48_10390, partial [Lachnospiraceae bacterium]|nr:hypothetical protein [Lachnospiraceae bacterium]